MASQKVRCPKCSTVLAVPGGIQTGVVRCGQCKTPFKFDFRPPSVEDSIADWLTDGKDAGAAAPETIDLGDVGDTTAAVGGDVRPRPPECPRLVSIEQGGAVFEFPADCLQKERFRLLMPRACIHCGARTHLSAHVLLWSSQLRDSASMETEHQAGKLVLDEKTTAKLKGADLLARLP